MTNLVVIAGLYPLVLAGLCTGWWFLLAAWEERRMLKGGPTTLSETEICVFAVGVPVMVATALTVGIVAYLT